MAQDFEFGRRAASSASSLIPVENWHGMEHGTIDVIVILLGSWVPV